MEEIAAMSSPAERTKLDKSGRYQAAKSLLRHKVLSGEIGEGEQLRPELEICRETNLSRTTVRKAIGDLVAEGLLVRFRGRGTFVNIRRSRVQKKQLALMACRHSHVSGAHELLVQGARQAAEDLGYQLAVVDSRNEEEAALRQAMLLNEQKVAGTVVVPPQTISSDAVTDRVVRALVRAGQKVVIADDLSGDDTVPSVSSQNEESMRELTAHLIAKGHRRIAFLTSWRTEAVRERESGFRQAMSEAGLPVRPEYFLEVGGRDPARQGTQEVDVFMAMREPPEAIVCLHDLIAFNVLRRCEERGWRVPQDVAVTGFDDLPGASTAHPPLTTMHQPLKAIGSRAVELLVRQLAGEPIGTVHERLPCRLVVRKSCGS